VRQAGQQYGHPRDVPIVLTGLVGRTEDDLVDLIHWDTRAAYRLADHKRGEIVRPDPGQYAAVAALSSSDAVDNECCTQLSSLSSHGPGTTSRPALSARTGQPAPRTARSPPSPGRSRARRGPERTRATKPATTAIINRPFGQSKAVNPVSQNAAHHMFEADAASRALGIELIEASEGRAVTRMRITPEMVNGHDIAHGGYVFLLADTTFACACNSHGPVTVAAGADITFVAPCRSGDLLTATAAEKTRYGRSGIYDVTVERDGQVVAEFRGRSRVVGK
jgi:acyl-CoA thioesterase